MAASYLFRLGTIKGTHGNLIALRHNKRTLQAARRAGANIDPTRTVLNYCLTGDDAPEVINMGAKIKLIQAGIETPRKNAVMGVEIIFSLPVDRHQQNTKPFFIDCLEWVKRHMAGELLAFDVHLDEAAPHAHAIILPLIDGKMQGNKLIGNKGNLARLRNLFYTELAVNYGLSRNTKKLTSLQNSDLERRVLTALKGDPVMASSVWACVRDSIHIDPLPFAQTLSIDPQTIQQSKVKSFVDCKRSHGYGSFRA